MSYNYETSNLWMRTLADRPEDEPNLREAKKTLRDIYQDFRKNIKPLIAQISDTNPNLTIHDITHLDALWQMADIIIDNSYPVTPLEAFLFGGSVLLHDSAMTLAAYRNGIEDIKNDPAWSDIVKMQFQKTGSINPTANQITSPPNEIYSEAISQFLREKHAAQAEKLATQLWGEEEKSFLISNNDARNDFGEIIGALAHSHWWPIEKVEKVFDKRRRNSPYWASASGMADVLKVACMLRIVDACHLDGRRAPRFARSLLNLTGESKAHWDFQERIDIPVREHDCLIYSGAEFPKDKSDAWWLCFDSLRMADGELRGVNSLLGETKRDRFAAQRIYGAESPGRLASKIPPSGWSPLDAHIHISDVPKIVKTLGGKALYGERPSIVLRELIQNAADAIRAMRSYRQRGDSYGDIIITHSEHNDLEWIEVADNGIGMSEEVITDFLLNFSASYWGSSLMRQELPGLLSSTFAATGTFGIGFFSVFMLGENLSVTTRRFDWGENETLVLEVNSGVLGRPILRRADSSEVMHNHGTKVRFSLPDGESLSDVFKISGSDSDGYDSFAHLVANVACSLDVSVTISQNGQATQVVQENDWISMNGRKLLERIMGDSMQIKKLDRQLDDLAKLLLPVLDKDGEIIARIAPDISDSISHPRAGAKTVGGLFASAEIYSSGVIKCTTSQAAREEATPIMAQDEIRVWADKEVQLLQCLSLSPFTKAKVAMALAYYGADVGDLPTYCINGEWKALNDPDFPIKDRVILLYEEDYEAKLVKFMSAKKDSNTDYVAIPKPNCFSFMKDYNKQFEFLSEFISEVLLDGWEKTGAIDENRKVHFRGPLIPRYGASMILELEDGTSEHFFMITEVVKPDCELEKERFKKFLNEIQPK